MTLIGLWIIIGFHWRQHLHPGGSPHQFSVAGAAFPVASRTDWRAQLGTRQGWEARGKVHCVSFGGKLGRPVDVGSDAEGMWLWCGIITLELGLQSSNELYN